MPQNDSKILLNKLFITVIFTKYIEEQMFFFTRSSDSVFREHKTIRTFYYRSARVPKPVDWVRTMHEALSMIFTEPGSKETSFI